MAKKFSTSTLRKTKNVKLFSIFTLITFGSLFWFKNEFQGKERYLSEISDEEFGFITRSKNEWVAQSSYEGDAQQILLSKPNPKLTDNFQVMICEPCPDPSFNFEKYIRDSLNQIRNIHHLDPSITLKSIKTVTKRNSKGYKYEDIIYTTFSTQQMETSKHHIAVFFENNCGFAIQSSNEISQFNEGDLNDIIENMEFFKPIKKMEFSRLKFYRSKHDRLSFEYPREWDLYQSYNQGVHQIQIIEPGNDKIFGTMYIQHSDSSFEEFAKSNDEDIKGMKNSTNGQMFCDDFQQQNKINQSGFRYQETRYDVVNAITNQRMKVKQCLFFENQTAYLIQTTGDEYNFKDDYLDVITNQISFF